MTSLGCACFAAAGDLARGFVARRSLAGSFCAGSVGEMSACDRVHLIAVVPWALCANCCGRELLPCVLDCDLPSFGSTLPDQSGILSEVIVAQVVQVIAMLWGGRR
jgi:hypothetical protein